MRSKLKKRLHKLLVDGVEGRLPGFSLQQEARVPRGDLVFVSRPVAGLWLYVVLEVSQDSDAFNLALAWSADDEALPRFGAMQPTDPPVSRKHRFALSSLWETALGRDPWYWRVKPLPRLGDTDAWLEADASAQELEERIDTLAADALDRLARNAPRYFAGLLADFRAGRI